MDEPKADRHPSIDLRSPRWRWYLATWMVLGGIGGAIAEIVVSSLDADGPGIEPPRVAARALTGLALGFVAAGGHITLANKIVTSYWAAAYATQGWRK